jgi:hypothetical protein
MAPGASIAARTEVRMHRQIPWRLGASFTWIALLAAGACSPPDGGSGGGGGRDGGDTTRPDGSAPGPGHDGGGSVGGAARALAQALRPGSEPHFLIGLGNDGVGADAGAYGLGTTLDLKYSYLVGFSDAGGWPTWNPDGSFVDSVVNPAVERGTTPMFTYYAMALEYEQGRDTLRDEARMSVYMNDVKLLYTRLAALDTPAVVHFEPDLMGYLQQRLSSAGATPDSYDVALHTAAFHDCDDLPATAHGWARCLVRMARSIAPKVRVGFQASQWAVFYDPADIDAPVEETARAHAAFLVAIGAHEADVLVVETLDRDAGYWETHAWNGSEEAPTGTCSVTETGRGYPLYWDETNTTVPNFHQHFRWISTLTGETGLPALWWQLPLGVPSDTCGGENGGADGRYRDNRVRYFFAHVDELIAAGGVGAVWGVGAGRQTYIDSDGGQFQDAVNRYFAAPVALP